MGDVPSKTIIRRIKEVARQFDAVKFQFVKKEGNLLADWLARTCASVDVNLHILDVPNFHVKKLLLEDKFDLSYVRINCYKAIKCLFYLSINKEIKLSNLITFRHVIKNDNTRWKAIEVYLLILH